MNSEYLPGFYDRRERRRDACRLLFLATEGDAPLFDFAWEISSGANRPDVVRARRLLRLFLRWNWIDLFRDLIEPAGHLGERGNLRQVGVERDEAVQLVDRFSWSEAEGFRPEDLQLVISATRQGELAWDHHVARRPHHRVGFNG